MHDLLAYALTELRYRGGRPDATRRTLAGTQGDGGRPPGLQRVNVARGRWMLDRKFRAAQVDAVARAGT